MKVILQRPDLFIPYDYIQYGEVAEVEDRGSLDVQTSARTGVDH